MLTLVSVELIFFNITLEQNLHDCIQIVSEYVSNRPTYHID